VVRTDSGGTDPDLEAAGGGALAGIPGVIYGRGSANVNELYMDVGDRNSYPGTGSTITDLVGSRSGSIDAAVTISNGHLLWSGATGAVTYTTDSSIEDIFDSGGTVIAWIRPNAFGGGPNLGRIAGTEDSAAYGWFLGMGSPSGSTYRIWLEQDFDGGSDGQWYTGSTLTLHQWQMVAVTYDNSSTGNDPTFYLNGIADTTTESTAPTGTRRSDSGNDLYVGNRGNDDRTFDGAIDVVMLFDTILSAEEIRQIYRVTQDRLRPSLIGTDAFNAAADAQAIYVRGGTGGSTSGKGAPVYVLGGDTAGDDAGVVRIIGGNYTGTTAGKVAGTVDIAGGDNDSGTGDAGHVTLTGGGKDGVGGAAGSITITSGAKTTSGSGAVGALTLATAAGHASAQGADLRIEVTGFSTSNNLGDLILQAGSNPGSGHPGDLYILGADSATAQNAGEIFITGGDATGILFGGHIHITSGASTNYYTGSINLTTPAHTSGSRGTGSITITVGDTYGNYGNAAGTLTLQGSNHTGSLGSGDAGSIVCYAGNNASNDNANNADGGDFIASAGDQTGTGTALPGDVKLNAGSKTAGNATGGHVYLYAGNGYGTGAGGNVYALTGEKGTGQDGWFEVRNRASASDKGWRVTEFDKVQTTTNTAFTVMTVGSLTVNGTNLAVDAFVTGHGDTSTTEVASARKIVTFYRDAATVYAMTYHMNNNAFVGSGSAMTVSLTISGNNVLLQVTGQSGVTVNWSGIVKVKKGGK
jgi:hypothetical protein